MPAIVSMLRGVNVGGHNKIKMDALRTLYAKLGLKSPQSYVQSGNIVFLSAEKDLTALSKRIQTAIEKGFGFRPDVVLRSSTELRTVISRNPFAKRQGIEPAKLLVAFLANEPGKTARENLKKIDTKGEELHFHGNEIYIYFKNGMGQTKLSWAAIEKALSTSYTGRNWNTVSKLLEIAEALEHGS